MKIFLAVIVFSQCGILLANIPQPVITFSDSYNGHVTVAGRLAAKYGEPVGISIQHGNLMYSTLTDAEGRWGIVIRHTTVDLYAQSWSLSKPSDRSVATIVSVK